MKKLDAWSPLGYSCIREVNELASDVHEFLTGHVVKAMRWEVKCKCGRSSRLVKAIGGRNENYILTLDCRQIG